MASETYTWVLPDGSSQSLSQAPNLGVLVGMHGRFMPPIRFVEDKTPLTNGARLRDSYADPRDVDLPIFVQGTDNIDLRNKLRNMMHWFDPLTGDGKLLVTNADGSSRYLVCRYSKGMEITEDAQNSNVTWQQFIATFHAVDPFWYDNTQQSSTVGASTGKNFLGTPFFPLNILQTSVFGTVTITNPGDVEAWPIWTINGPGSNFIIQDQTTGDSLTINTSIATGESITIDTRIGYKSIKKNDGTNLMQYLDPTSSLFSIPRGSNTMVIQMTGSTGDSLVTLNYSPRYWSP